MKVKVQVRHINEKGVPKHLEGLENVKCRKSMHSMKEALKIRRLWVTKGSWKGQG